MLATAAKRSSGSSGAKIDIPEEGDAEMAIEGRKVRLTNLDKVFWRSEGWTKGDLLRYYAAVSPYLLPHVIGRANVMKRYPHGIEGEFFFMKRTPAHSPRWLRTCKIEHASGSIIAFPVIDGLAALLWIVNLGCIDLNPWYGICGHESQPDYVHFDMDPVGKVDFQKVCEAALLVRDGLRPFRCKVLVKTSGSRGLHLYVPIVRGPSQKEVWSFAKTFARELASQHPSILTAEYRKSKRPAGRVLVDYNQNAWGRTLASVYSVRPRPGAPVSTPVTFAEIERGIRIEDFDMRTVLPRLRKRGDLWEPLLASRGRFDLGEWL